MNSKLLITSLFVASITLLSACSTNTDYLEAKTLPPVSPPDTLDKDRLGQLYPVPEQNNEKAPKKFSIPLPPTVGVQEDDNLASIQTMGDEFWVLNNKPPANTWTQLINFWQERSVAVIKRDLKTATLLTDWFDKGIQPGYQIRYRFRIEQGLQPSTTDIFVDNEKRQVTASPTNTAVVFDNIHADLLATQLVESLNKTGAEVGDSFLAATIELPQKVRLSEFDGEPVLLSVARKDRLHRALSNALSKEEFVTYDQNEAQTVYLFGEQKTGSKRWFGSAVNFLVDGSSTPSGDQPLDNILRHLPNEPDVNRLFPDVASRDTSKKISGNKGYLLVLRPQQQQTVVYVRDSAGRVLPTDEAIALLDTIRLRLI